MKQSIWAVIAAKDEEKHIASVVSQTKKYVNNILVIDDGSNDSTRAKAQEAGAHVLSHIVNLGKGASTNTGCEYAIAHKATHLILLDADGQHEPKDIPKFIERLKDCDVVLGARTQRTKMPAVLKLGNFVINTITKILYGVNIQDSQCGFRAFSASAYKKIRWESPNYSMESEMIANIGKQRLKYSQIPISTIYADRYKGTTVIDGVKIVMNMFWWKLSRW